MNRPTPPTPKVLTASEQEYIDRSNRTYAAAHGLIAAMKTAGVTEHDDLIKAAKTFCFVAAASLRIDWHELSTAICNIQDKA